MELLSTNTFGSFASGQTKVRNLFLCHFMKSEIMILCNFFLSPVADDICLIRALIPAIFLKSLRSHCCLHRCPVCHTRSAGRYPYILWGQEAVQCSRRPYVDSAIYVADNPFMVG